MDEICTSANRGDRERLFKWLFDNTSATWESGDSPWPCPELEKIRRVIFLKCTEGGLSAELGKIRPKCKIVTPMLFCERMKKQFPIVKPDDSVKGKRPKPDKQLSLKG